MTAMEFTTNLDVCCFNLERAVILDSFHRGLEHIVSEQTHLFDTGNGARHSKRLEEPSPRLRIKGYTYMWVRYLTLARLYLFG